MSYPVVLWGGESEEMRIVAIDEYDFTVENLNFDALMNPCWFAIGRVNAHHGDRVLFKVLCGMLEASSEED